MLSTIQQALIQADQLLSPSSSLPFPPSSLGSGLMRLCEVYPTLQPASAIRKHRVTCFKRLTCRIPFCKYSQYASERACKSLGRMNTENHRLAITSLSTRSDTVQSESQNWYMRIQCTQDRHHIQPLRYHMQLQWPCHRLFQR